MRNEKSELLSAADLDGVVALERLCFRTHWTREQFLLGLERGAFRILGVRLGEVLVAYAAFSVIAGDMELMNIAVHPKERRKGLAKRMMAHMLAICRAEGVRYGFLEVRRSNFGAIDLYEKFGFTHVGERKNYYPDNHEDALVYRLDFGRRADPTGGTAGRDRAGENATPQGGRAC